MLATYLKGGALAEIEGWNISTASYVQTFSVAAQDGKPFGLFFSPDGLKMYVVGDDGKDINEYDVTA